MKTPRRSLLLAFPVVALSLAACGGPPEGTVAVVKANSGDLEVTDAQYKRFFNYALSQAQQKEVSKIVPLVAPDFKACIADKRKAIPTDSQRKKTPDNELKKQCDDQYESVKNSAISTTTSLLWIKGEADRRGITFRKAEIARERSNLVNQQFQGEAGYKAFLKQSGLNQADVDLNVVAVNLGQRKIVEQLQAEVKEPTDADLRAAYQQRKATFTQPETRDLRLILTKDEAQAKLAKADIEAGRSWTETAKKYSTDPATKDQGGKVLATTADLQPPQFAGTVFKAKKNDLVGPLKTASGWYVVKIQNVNAAKTSTFEEVKDQLKQTVAGEQQQKSSDAFVKQFEKRWAGRTVCASEFDDVVACGGEPADPTSPTTAPEADRPPARDGGTGVPTGATRRPAEETQIDPAAAAQQQAAQQQAGG